MSVALGPLTILLPRSLSPGLGTTPEGNDTERLEHYRMGNMLRPKVSAGAFAPVTRKDTLTTLVGFRPYDYH